MYLKVKMVRPCKVISCKIMRMMVHCQLIFNQRLSFITMSFTNFKLMINLFKQVNHLQSQVLWITAKLRRYAKAQLLNTLSVTSVQTIMYSQNVIQDSAVILKNKFLLFLQKSLSMNLKPCNLLLVIPSFKI